MSCFLFFLNVDNFVGLFFKLLFFYLCSFILIFRKDFHIIHQNIFSKRV